MDKNPFLESITFMCLNVLNCAYSVQFSASLLHILLSRTSLWFWMVNPFITLIGFRI